MPLGIWRATESVIGDASGGVEEIDIRFQFTDGPRSSLLFSLEQYHVSATRASAGTVRMQTLNMDRQDPTTLPTPIWSVPLLPASQGGVATADAERGRLFLGAPSGPNETSILLFSLNNVLNDILHVTAGGYYWGPRSINAEGGPSKPLEGLYS